MDSSPRSWADFHFLNTALSDVTSSGSRNAVKCWIQPALVRLSYRASMKELLKDVRRPTKSIEGLAVEYAVPFPLCYLFHPAALEDYNDVFVLLLQLRRARYVLEMTLIRYPSKDPRQQKEMMKHLYALRSRLSWIVKCVGSKLFFLPIRALMRFFTAHFQISSLLMCACVWLPSHCSSSTHARHS